MNILWTIALVIMLAVAYAWGYDNGQNKAGQLDADRALELEKYRLDMFYEHERWLEERRGGRDVPNA